MLVYLFYFSLTQVHERSIDAHAHLLYVEYLFLKVAFPVGSDCIICHHPPLYHLVAAFVSFVCEVTGIIEPERGIQLLGAACMLGFVLAGATTLDRFVRAKWLVTLGTLLCGLWPYSIIMSGRVHNDMLCAAMMAWAVYACVRFYEEPSKRWFRWGLLFSGLSILTKMSGLLAFALLIFTVLVRCWRGPAGQGGRPDATKILRMTGPGIALGCLLLLAYLGTRDRSVCNADALGFCTPSAEPQGMKFSVLGSAGNATQGQKLDSSVLDYLYIDPVDLVTMPYSVRKLEGEGSDVFWNAFLKSSLFSTYNGFVDGETSHAVNRKFASALMVLQLAMLVYLFGCLVGSGRKELPRMLVLLGSVALFLAGAVSFRMIEATSHHADFRHVFAVLCPMVALYTIAVDRNLQKQPLVAKLGIALAGLFCSVSVLYFVPKIGWSVVEEKSETLTRDLGEFLCEDGDHPSRGHGLTLAWNQDLVLELKRPQVGSNFALLMKPERGYSIELIGHKAKAQLAFESGDSTDEGKPPTLELGTHNSIGELTKIKIRPQSVGFEYSLVCVMQRKDVR